MITVVHFVQLASFANKKIYELKCLCNLNVCFFFCENVFIAHWKCCSKHLNLDCTFLKMFWIKYYFQLEAGGSVVLCESGVYLTPLFAAFKKNLALWSNYVPIKPQIMWSTNSLFSTIEFCFDFNYAVNVQYYSLSGTKHNIWNLL